MSWLDEPAERMPTEEDVELLKLNLGKEIIRSGRGWTNRHMELARESIEAIYGQQGRSVRELPGSGEVEPGV